MWGIQVHVTVPIVMSTTSTVRIFLLLSIFLLHLDVSKAVLALIVRLGGAFAEFRGFLVDTAAFGFLSAHSLIVHSALTPADLFVVAS